jgi:autotransporter-associated beta strand protein
VETVNGLFSSGVESEIFVTNQTAMPATLRVGANDATSTFGGAIADDPSFLGPLSLVKIGSGSFSLTGISNAYSGDAGKAAR